MRKLMLVPFLLVLLGLTTTLAYAAPPQPASGAFTVAPAGPPSVQQHGNVCHVDLSVAFNFTGDLTGSAPMDFRIVHKGPCTGPAAAVFTARGTYAGTVQVGDTTVAGTFDLVFTGTIDIEGNAQGNLVVLKGTEGLANLQGRLTLTGLAGVSGTYDGQMHLGGR